MVFLDIPLYKRSKYTLTFESDSAAQYIIAKTSELIEKH